MVVKEKMEITTFKELMNLQGYNNTFNDLYWDSHFNAPQFGDIKTAIHRGFIPESEIDRYLKLIDLDPKFNDTVWKPLLTDLPNVSELINERTKEVISQDTFAKGLKGWGYDPVWSQRIWDAHFQPANFTDFITAMRRKDAVNVPRAEGEPMSYQFGNNAAMDINVVKQLSELADYDPRYWDFYKTRLYNDPSYRMIQWGYETGSILESEVPDLVHRLGLNPKDESWYGNFIMHFQERPWIVKYLTALQAAYVAKAIDATELKARVKAIPRNEAVADWMIKIADVRIEIEGKGNVTDKPSLIAIGELKQMYIQNIIDEDKILFELRTRGYIESDIQIMLSLLNSNKETVLSGGSKFGLSVAEMFEALKYGFISEDRVRTELLQKNMTLEDANILISTKLAKINAA
jgi:hypothetical protein